MVYNYILLDLNNSVSDLLPYIYFFLFGKGICFIITFSILYIGCL